MIEETHRFDEGVNPLDAQVAPASSWKPMLPPLGILVGLDQRSLEDLAAFGQYHECARGTEIIREGDTLDRFYIVVSGELDVSARCGDRDLPLSTAREGECLGEVSLLEPGPASASIRVVKDAILWSMDMEALRAYLMAHTGDAGVMLMGMASCLSYRLRQANHLIQQHHIVPERTSSEEREQAITAGNTPVNVGLFERIKKSLALEKDKKVRISTKIQM